MHHTNLLRQNSTLRALDVGGADDAVEAVDVAQEPEQQRAVAIGDSTRPPSGRRPQRQKRALAGVHADDVQRVVCVRGRRVPERVSVQLGPAREGSGFSRARVSRATSDGGGTCTCASGGGTCTSASASASGGTCTCASTVTVTDTDADADADADADTVPRTVPLHCL
jgi:hypothetical protein